LETSAKGNKTLNNIDIFVTQMSLMLQLAIDPILLVGAYIMQSGSLIKVGGGPNT